MYHHTETIESNLQFAMKQRKWFIYRIAKENHLSSHCVSERYTAGFLCTDGK